MFDPVIKVPNDCFGSGVLNGLYLLNALVIAERVRFREESAVLKDAPNMDALDAHVLACTLPCSPLELKHYPEHCYVESKKPVPTMKKLLNAPYIYLRKDAKEIKDFEKEMNAFVGSPTPKRIMESIRNYLCLFSVVYAYQTGHFMLALSYDMDRYEWKMLESRFIKPFKKNSKDGHFDWEKVSRAIWKCCQSKSFQCSPISGLDRIIRTAVENWNQESFWGEVFQTIAAECQKCTRLRKYKPYVCFRGQLKAFLKEYVVEMFDQYEPLSPDTFNPHAPRQTKESGELTQLTKKVIDEDGNIQHRAYENIYGKTIPPGIANKDSVYFFLGFSVFLALRIKNKYAFNNKETSIFTVFLLQHMPFFNFRLSKVIPKQNALWPKAVPMHEQMESTISRPATLLRFLKSAVCHKGPADYQAWASKAFDREYLEHLCRLQINEQNSAYMNRCSLTFLNDHLTSLNRSHELLI